MLHFKLEAMFNIPMSTIFCLVLTTLKLDFSQGFKDDIKVSCLTLVFALS